MHTQKFQGLHEFQALWLIFLGTQAQPNHLCKDTARTEDAVS
jgi:hypothetical protein